MKILKRKLTKFLPLFILLTFSLIGNDLMAQSANHKANIIPDEFTSKGNVGWTIGSTVPNLSFNDINGKKFQLYDLLDKPLLIEFWSLKNAQCKKNKTYLKKFYEQYNINILGITTDDYPNQLRKFSKDQQLRWANVMDDSKKFSGETFAASQGIENVAFLIITPDKKVHAIGNQPREIGKMGVELQKYFK